MLPIDGKKWVSNIILILKIQHNVKLIEDVIDAFHQLHQPTCSCGGTGGSQIFHGLHTFQEKKGAYFIVLCMINLILH